MENTEITEPTTEVEQTTEPAEDGGKSGAEAAKYRRRLREAEAERDALSTRLETMQRAEAERLAAKHIAKASGLWAHVGLSDVLDEGGNVDPERVASAAQEARDALGLSQPRPAGYVPDEGRVVSSTGPGPSFADAFGPRG